MADESKTYIIPPNVQPTITTSSGVKFVADESNCSICNGNHYVAKVKPVGEPTLYLYSDENNYINCPICVTQKDETTDNGPAAEFK